MKQRGEKEMNVTQMNFSTKIDRIAAIKAQIEALQSDFDALRASIVEDLKASNTKSATSNGIKVSFSNAVYYTYSDSAVAFLEEKGFANCIEKKVVTSKVNACLKAGVIDEGELNNYRVGTVRESFTVKNV